MNRPSLNWAFPNEFLIDLVSLLSFLVGNYVGPISTCWSRKCRFYLGNPLYCNTTGYRHRFDINLRWGNCMSTNVFAHKFKTKQPKRWAFLYFRTTLIDDSSFLGGSKIDFTQHKCARISLYRETKNFPRYACNLRLMETSLLSGG